MDVHLTDEEPDEFIDALTEFENSSGSPEAEAELWKIVDHWLAQPLSSVPVQYTKLEILNQLTWKISNEHIGDKVWEKFRQLAKSVSHGDPFDLHKSIVISTFELFAEPPEVPETLNLLYSLAGDPDTRWAVFASYENYPWRLRPHAIKYSNGLITNEDCDAWLEEQCLGED